MIRFYDPANRRDLARIEHLLTEVGIEYTVTPPLRGSPLPGSIGIAEEDLPWAEEVLFAVQQRTRH